MKKVLLFLLLCFAMVRGFAQKDSALIIDIDKTKQEKQIDDSTLIST